MEEHNPHEIEHHTRSKHVGILIAVMAALLAFIEMASRNATTDVLRETMEASDTWAFFQAKTIRSSMLRADATVLQLETEGHATPEIAKTITDWNAIADREESEPSTGEGRKQLAAKAQEIEKRRDARNAAKETYEFASGVLELGILLGSTSIVVGLPALAYFGGVLGVVGAVLGALGLVAPQFIGG